jgi:hypothetical protein
MYINLFKRSITYSVTFRIKGGNERWRLQSFPLFYKVPRFDNWVAKELEDAKKIYNTKDVVLIHCFKG